MAAGGSKCRHARMSRLEDPGPQTPGHSLVRREPRARAAADNEKSLNILCGIIERAPIHQM